MMQSYIGRFAPSPSGPLHFGSLVCALISFLHARQAKGQWVVRIEDVDTTRVKAGADIIYQTNRQYAYQSAVDILHQKQLIYACSCTRQSIKSKGKYYTGTCRNLHLPFKNNAIRVINTCHDCRFQDLNLGEVLVDPLFCKEDVCIKRKDGLLHKTSPM
jgi:glutamyl-Q tRNA(Asp) synthetase